MKKEILLLSLLFVCCIISATPYKNVDPILSDKLQIRLEKLSKERALLIDNTVKYTASHKREATVFLFAHMPQNDLDTISMSIVTKSVDYGYLARQEYDWAKDVPNSIFYNDVLPYASMDETRENWRESFYHMLYPLLKECKTVEQAIDTINNRLKFLVKVEYNTKRKKANQSAFESMDIGMASCSGLSILMTNALRAAGIPSRIAGTPLWKDKSGNHNWCEAWVNGEWKSIEYYPAPMNEGWIYPKIGEFAGQCDPLHQVYASSFAPIGWDASIVRIEYNRIQCNDEDIWTYFPMVWNDTDKSVHGINVTERYINIYTSSIANKTTGDTNIEGNKYTKPYTLTIVCLKSGGDKRISEDRVSMDVEILNKEGKVIYSGKTSGPQSDMNDNLHFLLDKRQTYKITYGDRTKRIRRMWKKHDNRTIILKP